VKHAPRPFFFETIRQPDRLGVFTGALKNLDVDLVKIVDHIFVGDTKDGGATMWLRKPNPDGKEVPRFEKRNTGHQYPYEWPPSSSLSGYDAKLESGSVPIRCHCKGIDYVLKHGNYEGKTKEELPWFVDPNTHKLLASFDACDSCRLQSGIDILHWTFTDLANISFAPGSNEIDKTFPTAKQELEAAVHFGDGQIGTLAYYKSSPDVSRFFCKTCSATVFYTVDERPSIADLAVGLLDAPDGARAECFLSWEFGEPFSWVGDTNGGWREGFMQRVQAEAEEWRIARGYPKSGRRIAKEDAEVSKS